MKQEGQIFMVILLIVSSMACNSATPQKKVEKAQTGGEISVFYFHYSHRCSTCVAVEEQTKNALINLFGEQMKSGVITFQSVDMDEPEGEKLAKKMKVSGQTLLFIKGEVQKNLTNVGFMYAGTNPDKFVSEVQETVGNLLK